MEPVQLKIVPGIRIPIGEISHQERPNFDFSGKKGLHTCWGCYKRKQRGNVRIERILSTIEGKYMAPNFTVDGQQIMILSEYLEGVRS